MIDLHTHILPDIDDGPSDLATALVMARAAVADGVRTMAATPHGRKAASERSRYSVGRLREQLEALRTALAESGVALELVSGTEIYGEAGLLPRLRAGELLGYGASRALLVEFPASALPRAVEQLVFELQIAGYRVVVAHPERLHYAQRDPNTLIPLVERGALLQLTADALIGAQGERLRRLAEAMLTHGLAQLIASDCHGPHFERMPNLGAGRRRAAELIGPAAADTLVQTTPAAILADTPIVTPPPSRIRKLFGLL